MSDKNKKKQRTSAKLFRLPTRVTKSATVDSRNKEVEITDFMTRRACDIMDSKLQFPFAPRKRSAR